MEQHAPPIQLANGITVRMAVHGTRSVVLFAVETDDGDNLRVEMTGREAEIVGNRLRAVSDLV